MTIEVHWDDQPDIPSRSIIYWTFGPDWDWHEFSEREKQAFNMALEVPHMVDSIIDFRNNQRLPRSGALSYFTRSILKSPPNRGTVVIVRPTPLMHAIEMTLRRLYPQFSQQYVTVQTLDEAYTVLAERRLARLT